MSDRQDEGAAGREPGRAARGGPLGRLLVVDLSRMLPGAVLARALLQLGARVLRVEAPAGGDPMRALPPFRRQGTGKGKGGNDLAAQDAERVGAAFATFLAGAESIALDLRHPPAAGAVRRLVARADVLVESFRPGTLALWGLDPAELAAQNPRLIVCSLSSFGADPRWRDAIGHDLNFAAASGLATLLSGDAGPPRVPGVPIVDISGGILAACSILAALVERARTGRGRVLAQPLALAALPFLAWPWAELEAEARRGAGGATSGSWPLLTGAVPAYRLYRCSGDEWVALGAMEPKLWLSFLEMIGLPQLAPLGLDAGQAGQEAARQVQACLDERPRAEWLALARTRALPLTPLNDPQAALADPWYAAHGGAGAAWLGAASLPAGTAPAPAPAPRLGEHTGSVLRELGLTPEEIAAAQGR